MREPALGQPLETTIGLSGQEAIAFLAQAGDILARSLDFAVTARHLASLSIPQLADLCVIDLAGDGESVAVAARDPELARELERLRRRRPIDLEGPHPVARVIGSGTSILLPELDADTRASFAQGEEHARFMIDHRYRSAIVVPLVARGKSLGAISMLRLGESPSYTAPDLQLVEILARRAGLALDNSRLYSEVQRAETQLATILDNVAEAIMVLDRNGEVVYANRASVARLAEPVTHEAHANPGQMPDGLAGQRSTASFYSALGHADEHPHDACWGYFDEHGRKITRADLPAARLLRARGAHQPEPESLLLRRASAVGRDDEWFELRSSAVHDPTSGDIEFIVTVAKDVTAIKRAELSERFLAEASQVLGSSLDRAETIAQVSRLVVPGLADWCAVLMPGAGGEPRPVEIRHSDPGKREAVARLLNEVASPESPFGAQAEWRRSGRAELYEAIDETLGRTTARTATSLIFTPISVGPRIVGTLVLATSGSGRRLSPADLPLASELGRRAGAAIENARLYSERTAIAQTLQQALLPRKLPSIPGIEIAVRHHAAGELNDVGGDFYDAIACDDERFAIFLGDMCGKAEDAASAIGVARHTLRTAALTGLEPRAMLTTLHRALRLQPPGADMCTVCLLTLTARPRGAEVEIVLAGHPRPMLLNADGEVRPVGHTGTLLGMVEPLAFCEQRLELSPGETLLLYTDGLTDAGGQEPLGEDGLIALVEGLARTSGLDRLLERIEAAVLMRAGGDARDDTALLGIRAL